MKKVLYILTLLFFLAACNQNSSTTDVQKVDAISDTLTKDRNEHIEREIVNDSLVLYSDSLYRNLELHFTAISKNEFQSYKQNYKAECALDSGNFISGSDLYVSHHCNEICETYLAERSSNRKLLMPSDYDAGIVTMQLSPSCDQLLICSSYDGPDFKDYYENRAEIFVFKVNKGTGLKVIVPAFKYDTKKWSIEDLTWVDTKTIALKIYEEARWGDGSGVHYNYYKTKLSK